MSMQYKETQRLHESKKKEKEFERLKEKLGQVMWLASVAEYCIANWMFLVASPIPVAFWSKFWAMNVCIYAAGVGQESRTAVWDEYAKCSAEDRREEEDVG